jgi:tetrahydromethanopterin S-methyltransferase subunit G
MPSPLTLPRNVRDAFREIWSEEIADDFTGWLDTRFQQRAVPREEWNEVTGRLDRLENEMTVRFEQVDDRLDRIEDRLNQMDTRFDTVNERFDAMNARIGERFDAMNERFDERSDRIDEKLGQMSEQIDRMNGRILSMTRWLIGLLFFFGTMVTVLLAVVQLTAA